MKRVFAWVLVLVLCLGLFAGCKKDKDDQTPTGDATSNVADLEAALEYVKTVYRKPSEKTPKDFQRIGVVPVNGKDYEVVWSADVGEEYIKVVKGTDGMVTIDVNENVEADVKYVLTATISDDAGNSVSHDWNHILPAATNLDMVAIVEEAYKLEPGASMEYEVTLTGVISTINTPWSDDYQNITVTIKVAGAEDKPIQCYRLSGDGAKDLKIGDTITVTGTLKNYNGTIEFDAGCTLDAVVPGEVVEAPSDMKKIVDEAYALGANESLPYEATLTGTITQVGSPYDSNYKNVTVTIVVDGRENKPIVCYRLKGDGADKIGVNDVITVKGYITNYVGEKGHSTIEFTAGCVLVKWEDKAAPKAPTDPKAIVDAAYALGANESLKYEATLTGKITKVGTAYDASFGNITVTMVVEGRETKPIVCYRMKGDGVDKISIGDTITVKGYITNYVGEQGYSTIEFNYPELVSYEKNTNKAPTDPLTIVKEAYALKAGEQLPYEATLTGKITEVNTAYDVGYKNVTVTIVVAGAEDKPIKCYRLKGDGADKIGVGDTVTVKGFIEMYQHESGDTEVEYTAGCVLVKWENTGADAPVAEATEITIAEAIAKGSAMAHNTYTTEKYKVTGTITEVYNTTYGNMKITDGNGNILTIYGTYDKDGNRYDAMTTKPIAGDTVTIEGVLGQYYDVAQIKNGVIVSHTSSGVTPPAPVVPELPTTDGAVVSIADAIAAGTAMQHNTYTELKYKVTGEITEVYDTTYGNMRIKDADGNILTVYGTWSADGSTRYDALDVKPVAGDTVTVYGVIGQYNGTAQVKNGWIVAHTPAGTTPDPDPEVPATLAEQIAEANQLANGAYLSYESTITGTITDTPSASSYAEGSYKFTVSDGTNTLLCYYVPVTGGTPAQGDTVTVTGYLTAYNGSAQFDSTASAVLAGSAEVPATLAEQIAEANQLANGAYLSYESTITGTITDTPSASSYAEGSYKFTVSDGTNTLLCYYVPVTGGTPAQGDTVTVTGYLTAYNGSAQFDSTAAAVLTSSGNEPTEMTPAEIVEAAYALESGAALEGTYTLSGVITEVVSAYDSTYGNVTVTIVVEGMTNYPIECYRLAGTGAEVIAVGDNITVTGTIKNYYGKIEFDQGCTLDAYKTPAQIVDETYALASGAALAQKYTLTGVITEIGSAYNSAYGNVTVTIVVGDKTDKPIICYRLKGTGADAIEIGDTITVTGILTNYNGGTYEFGEGCTLDAYKKAETGASVPTATISFADTANRTEFSTAKQVWSMNDVTVTNDKAASTNNVADYSNPIRCYAGSSITIAYAGMKKIEVTCNSTSYATALQNSLAEVTGATVTVNGKVVTIELDEAADSFVISQLTAQVRINELTVYGEQVVIRSAEVSFADTANRTEFSTAKQVWSMNDVTVTNDKAASTNNVADYSNPIRCYAGSSITIAYAGMKKIEVTCNSTSYATALQNSLAEVTGATVTVNGKVVTIELDEAADSFVISQLTAQVRINSLIVYTG